MEDVGLSRVDPSFWAGRRVLLTGHTGFKGGWAALWLARMGARVMGLALAPETDPNLFHLANVSQDLDSRIADVRDRQGVASIIAETDPELVIHMAAQPLVRRSIAQPVETFAINVLGTVHVLEALRNRPALSAALMVTTDKVYQNHERGISFGETDPLGGHEPYGASKAAAEIAVEAMARTYFEGSGVAIATARGGNVIGGGDFSSDRLVPDIIRAVDRGSKLALRNPSAIRPWQYVLDCLAGYFCFLQALSTKKTCERALNFGPSTGGVSVQALSRSILAALGATEEWDSDPSQSAHEANILELDTTRSHKVLGWRDLYPGDRAVQATAAWYLAWRQGHDMRDRTLAAIDEFMSVEEAAVSARSARKTPA
jgi:CDP-glucose 4,6-dehydratase